MKEMEKCIRCEMFKNKEFLLDVISRKGIVKICEDCNDRENLPPIKKAYDNSGNEKIESKQSVRDRLSRITGVDPEKHKVRRVENKVLKEQNNQLRDIVESKLKEGYQKPGDDSNMVKHFHWIIMRARRKRHLTQKQLGEAISEPEITIKMIERGILPREREALIKKIENYLNLKLTKVPEGFEKRIHELNAEKENQIEKPKVYGKFESEESFNLEDNDFEIDQNENNLDEEDSEEINFKTITAKNPAIRDLKRLKNKIEEKFFKNNKNNKKEKDDFKEED